MRNPLSISSQQGFTLIELLTAVAIASVIMILLLGLMVQSSSTYRSAQSAVNILSESRAFLKYFKADLSSRQSGTALMSEVSETDPDKIAFIRALSFDERTAGMTGDLNTSLYYVAYTGDKNGPVSPKLYRRTLDAKATQTLIESSPTPTLPIGKPAEDEPIIYNVVKFKARPQQMGDTGKPEPWTAASSKPPAFLEITIDLTDDFTASRYRTEASWSELRNPAGKVARQSVRSYTQTIQLSQ